MMADATCLATSGLTTTNGFPRVMLIVTSPG
jgi:hypothetical protein